MRSRVEEPPPSPSRLPFCRRYALSMPATRNDLPHLVAGIEQPHGAAVLGIFRNDPRALVLIAERAREPQIGLLGGTAHRPWDQVIDLERHPDDLFLSLTVAAAASRLPRYATPQPSWPSRSRTQCSLKTMSDAVRGIQPLLRFTRETQHRRDPLPAVGHLTPRIDREVVSVHVAALNRQRVPRPGLTRPVIMLRDSTSLAVRTLQHGHRPPSSTYGALTNGRDNPISTCDPGLWAEGKAQRWNLNFSGVATLRQLSLAVA